MSNHLFHLHHHQPRGIACLAHTDLIIHHNNQCQLPFSMMFYRAYLHTCIWMTSFLLPSDNNIPISQCSPHKHDYTLTLLWHIHASYNSDTILCHICFLPYIRLHYNNITSMHSNITPLDTSSFFTAMPFHLSISINSILIIIFPLFDLFTFLSCVAVMHLYYGPTNASMLPNFLCPLICPNMSVVVSYNVYKKASNTLL